MKLSGSIIFENEDIVAVNKPTGLLSIPDRLGKDISLKKILQDSYGNIYTVHRLDKETSGVILFAKNETAHRHLSIQFEERNTEKIYFGLLAGSVQPQMGTVEQPISEHPVKKGTMTIHHKGKEALTEYKVIEYLRSYSWVHFRIHTGRTHQIRVHAKYLGHPVACDELYGDDNPILLSKFKHNFKLGKDVFDERPLLDRLALHAFSLRVTDVDGKELYLEAPVPKDLMAVLQQLRKLIR